MRTDVKPVFVGHRGYPAVYPENTLPGFRAALEAGAEAIECDIQFSREGVPVVIHDADLRRTAGRPGRVADLSLAELQAVSVHEAARLGADATPVPLPTLADLVTLLGNYPDAVVFVEIKEEAFADFSRRYCVDQVLDAVAPLGDKAVIISFDADTVALARRAGASTGWVLKRYNIKSRLKATTLEPDYLICNYRKLPRGSGGLWPGRWQWFVYDLVDWPLAESFVSRGVKYIETWDIGTIQEQWQQENAAGKE